LAGFASVLAEAPWAITAADVDALRAVGLNSAAVLHAVVLASYFNYLNRVADAVDIEFDYQSPLPRLLKDPARTALPRPPRAGWSAGPPPLPMRLSERPTTHEPFVRWSSYVLEREAPLSRRERQVLVRAVAAQLGDLRGYETFADADPRDARERTLADYAVTLTVEPWKLTQAHVATLHELGLDDVGVLEVIAVSSFQNTASRLNLVLAPEP
jgi:alkylhydroperoxidase family enzyme